jgi:Na+/proline symporter
MMVFLPHGLLGLVVASIAAAYMSTISTHLNWGASYIVDDFYKRFIATNKSEKHYVFVARIVTFLLMFLGCCVALLLDSAQQAFSLLVQVGAGTGLLYLLRWFWWRVNAWSEIAAMFMATLLAIYFKFFQGVAVEYMNTNYPDIYFVELENWRQMVVGVAITTVFWVLITFITPKTKIEVLQNYYNKIRPMGRGWKKIVDTSHAQPNFSLTHALMAVFFGMASVYGALFSTGYYIYGKYEPAVALTIISAFSIFAVLRLLPQIRHNES